MAARRTLRPRTRVLIAVVSVVACTQIVTAQPRSIQAAPGEPRPNILIIMTDDQRADGTLWSMPFTRRWFKDNGIHYRNAFATTPVCCPARASILTGLYAHNHEVTKQAQGHSLPEGKTFAAYLRANGYLTAYFGKFINNWPLHRDPKHYDDWAIFANAEEGFVGGKWNADGDVRRIWTYGTKYVEQRTRHFVQWTENADDRPWMAVASVAAPHRPFTPEKKYENGKVPGRRPPKSVGENIRDKPAYVKDIQMGQRTIENMRTKQIRTLWSVDDMVRSLASVLAKNGETRNTLAIFVSDNGFLWGEHGLTKKSVPYAESVKIPLYVRWPGGGVPTGVVRDRLVANVDLAPTILAEAGINGPPMDGHPLFGGEPRKELLLEFFGSGRIPPWYSLWNAEEGWQYTEYLEHTSGDGRKMPRDEEYYNLRKDPLQNKNELDDEETVPQKPMLQLRLDRLKTCSEEGLQQCP